MPAIVTDNSNSNSTTSGSSKGRREESREAGFDSLFEAVQTSLESSVAGVTGKYESGMGNEGGPASTAEERIEQLNRNAERQESYRDTLKEGREANKAYRERGNAKAEARAAEASAASKQETGKKGNSPVPEKGIQQEKTSSVAKGIQQEARPVDSGRAPSQNETPKAETDGKTVGTEGKTGQPAKATLPTPVQSPGQPDSSSVQSASIAKQVGQALCARVTNNSSTPGVSGVGPVAGQAVRANAQETASRVQKEPAPSHSQSQAKTSQTGSTEQTDFNRLIKSIRMNIGERDSSARLHLNPPELGRVRVDVRMSDQRISVEIHTETSEAREILGSRIESLREGLSNAGIDVEKMEIASAFPETANDSGEDGASGTEAHTDGDGQDHSSASGTSRDSTALLADSAEDAGLAQESGERRVVSETQLDIRV